MRSTAPRRRGAGGRALRILAVLSSAWVTAHFSGCGRDFNHPFDPGSDGYAGSAWSRDGDGDGIADSVEKYAPGCAGGPADCLRKAQANAGLLPSRLDSVAAEDMSLLAGGSAAAPRLRWYPAGLSGVSYTLVPDDPGVAAAADSLIQPLQPGTTGFTLTARVAAGQPRTARFTVTVLSVRVPVRGISAWPLSLKMDDPPAPPQLEFFPADATDRSYALSGGDPAIALVTVDGRIRPMGPGVTWLTASVEGGLTADFSVSVEAVIVPVKAVKVPDMTITLLTEADDRVREPAITWTPADATDKGYSLSSDNPAVVRVVGGSVEAMRKGEAKVTITSHDGNKRDTFKVKVNVLIPCGGLLNPCPDDD